MLQFVGVSRALLLASAVALFAFSAPAGAQEPAARKAQPEVIQKQEQMNVGAGTVAPPAAGAPVEAKRAATMQRLDGMWVEGRGFEVTYGNNYDNCAKRCLANATCVMIEYYRPEKKCNLYNTMRPRLKGGSSDVAIRG